MAMSCTFTSTATSLTEFGLPDDNAAPSRYPIVLEPTPWATCTSSSLTRSRASPIVPRRVKLLPVSPVSGPLQQHRGGEALALAAPATTSTSTETASLSDPHVHLLVRCPCNSSACTSRTKPAIFWKYNYYHINGHYRTYEPAQRLCSPPTAPSQPSISAAASPTPAAEMSSSTSSPPWDYIAKLVCIGDSGCGKSSLTIRLCEGRFSPQHDVTIGVEFGSRIVPVGPPHSKTLGTSSNSNREGGLPDPPKSDAQQKHMKLSLWDTAGQETYKSVTRSYFRGASGALLVFDISRKQTFAHVTDWLNDLRQIAEPDIVVILVGNKADLTTGEENKREVTVAEAEEWARNNGVLQYVETSAKSGEGVELAFMKVAERIFDNINAGKYDLNDRRSGVKGPTPGMSGRGQVKLGDQKSSGGCC
ncbi:GTP-binding protein rab2 [Seiridium cupressi]